MHIATGKVVGGKVVVEGLDLTEGEVVTVLTRDAGTPVELSADEERALLESIAEAEQGNTITPEELFVRLSQPAKQ